MKSRPNWRGFSYVEAVAVITDPGQYYENNLLKLGLFFDTIVNVFTRVHSESEKRILADAKMSRMNVRNMKTLSK